MSTGIQRLFYTETLHVKIRKDIFCYVWSLDKEVISGTKALPETSINQHNVPVLWETVWNWLCKLKPQGNKRDEKKQDKKSTNYQEKYSEKVVFLNTQ